MNYKTLAGALLFIAGVVVIMGIITAEATYPDYSTRTNDISDLGATRWPNSVIKQPAATIFTATLVAVGVLVIVSGYAVYRGLGAGSLVTALAILLVLYGIFALGVAAFNGSTEQSLALHTLFSLLVFTVGGLAAIVSYGVLRAPFSIFAVILGIIALASIAINIIYQDANPLFAVIGLGGVERWIVYPSVMWLIGFGGYLMGHASLAGAAESAARDNRV